MQYYRLGETLEPLENLSPEETHLLAVLRPEELHSAPLPAGLPLPAHRAGSAVRTAPPSAPFLAVVPAPFLFSGRGSASVG